ncbi:SpaH/EbpB family LPXTG-anchored major pilin [Nocardioides jishulii]|uniref:SpaH/EbpB family LPXTG-anchored major pilin n=1 Tax=Nocardioides jishulii TaxID=2575440 RepID=UPI001BAFE0E0|nr:SpaH/EbpB family LPXTG-anchored major pilin [Nocardioides jishulii]
MSPLGRNRATRLLSVLGAGALALGALALTPAHAAPSYGNIDENASGTIVVHKHENQVGTDAVQDPDGNGTPIPTPPVSGVKFTAYQILDADGKPVDLTVPSTWDHLEDLKVSADGTTLTGGPGAPSGPWTVGGAVDSATTDAQGEATLEVDTIGAYVVVESDAPADVVQQAAPFVVTIPFPWEDGWLYDVNVYPKNALASVSKSVEQQPAGSLGLGSVVTFPVSAKIPSLAPGTSFENYVVRDTLDDRLDKVGVGTVTVEGAAVDKAYYDVVVTGHTVRVEFTEAGLAWLKSQGGKHVVVDFVGTIARLGDGVLKNEADVFVNDPDEQKGLTTNEVSTHWGDLVLHKTDASNPGTGLEGAVFEVYAADTPYADQCSAAKPVGSPLAVNGATQFTSGADGRIQIAGLFVSDSVNEKVDAGQRCYVLKEVQAPAGFATPSGDAALTPVAVKTGATADVDVTIENAQQRVPGIPLTGGQGSALLVIGGLALLGLALAVMLRNRRRESQV